MKRSLLSLSAAVAAIAGVCLAQPQAVPSSAPAPAAPSVRPNTAIIPNLQAGFAAKHATNVEVAKKGGY